MFAILIDENSTDKVRTMALISWRNTKTLEDPDISKIQADFEGKQQSSVDFVFQLPGGKTRLPNMSQYLRLGAICVQCVVKSVSFSCQTEEFKSFKNVKVRWLPRVLNGIFGNLNQTLIPSFLGLVYLDLSKYNWSQSATVVWSWETRMSRRKARSCWPRRR